MRAGSSAGAHECAKKSKRGLAGELLEFFWWFWLWLLWPSLLGVTTCFRRLASVMRSGVGFSPSLYSGCVSEEMMYPACPASDELRAITPRGA